MFLNESRGFLDFYLLLLLLPLLLHWFFSFFPLSSLNPPFLMIHITEMWLRFLCAPVFSFFLVQKKVSYKTKFYRREGGGEERKQSNDHHQWSSSLDINFSTFLSLSLSLSLNRHTSSLICFCYFLSSSFSSLVSLFLQKLTPKSN